MSGRGGAGGVLWRALVFVAVAGGTFGVLTSASSCFQWDSYLDGCRDAGNCLPVDGGCPQDMSCYTGPPGTAGVGICSSGGIDCFTGEPVCVNQQLPMAAETCGNDQDDDCNGMVDDGCAGSSDAGSDGGSDAGSDAGTGSRDGGSDGGCTAEGICYTGPLATRNQGICRDGTWVCSGGNLVCSGEQTPLAESCSNTLDDDCDGAPDSLDTDCTCRSIGQMCDDSLLLCCPGALCVASICTACHDAGVGCSPGEYCCSSSPPVPCGSAMICN